MLSKNKVQVYTMFILCREARDAMLVWERFYETSGYLTFEKGETVKAIVVSTTDDAVPEPQMNYLIRIADVMDDRKVMKEQAVISKNEGMLEITGIYLLIFISFIDVLLVYLHNFQDYPCRCM